MRRGCSSCLSSAAARNSPSCTDRKESSFVDFTWASCFISFLGKRAENHSLLASTLNQGCPHSKEKMTLVTAGTITGAELPEEGPFCCFCHSGAALAAAPRTPPAGWALQPRHRKPCDAALGSDLGLPYKGDRGLHLITGLKLPHMQGYFPS